MATRCPVLIASTSLAFFCKPAHRDAQNSHTLLFLLVHPLLSFCFRHSLAFFVSPLCKFSSLTFSVHSERKYRELHAFSCAFFCFHFDIFKSTVYREVCQYFWALFCSASSFFLRFFSSISTASGVSSIPFSYSKNRSNI